MRLDRQLVNDWSAERAFRSGRVTLKDYDHPKPKAKLEAKANNAGGYQHGNLELYDYHGRYSEQDVGDRRAKVRLQAEQTRDRRRLALGTAASLHPGGLISV